MRLLGVDVDLCVCPSDKGWMEYLRYYKGLGKELEFQGKLPYNLSEMFPTVADPLHYWRTLDYAQFSPLEGSVESLEKLSQYFGIVFISRIKGNHTKSKYYWLKEHFPFMTSYVATKEKWVCDVVGMVDDRMDVLSKFPPEKRILFETPYQQAIEVSVAMSFNTWGNSVVKKICEVYL